MKHGKRRNSKPRQQRVEEYSVIKALFDKIHALLANIINSERAERRQTPSWSEAQGRWGLAGGQDSGHTPSPPPPWLEQPWGNKLTPHFLCLVLSEIDFIISIGFIFTTCLIWAAQIPSIHNGERSVSRAAYPILRLVPKDEYTAFWRVSPLSADGKGAQTPNWASLTMI